MTKREVEKIVRANFKRYARMFGLDHLTLSWEVDEIESDAIGTCYTNDAYARAHVVLDSRGFDSEEAVLKTLRHELFHAVLSPFDLYRNFMSAHLHEDSPESKREEAIKANACERQVAALERMYQAMTRKGS